MPKQLEWNRELVNRFWDGVALTRLSEISFSRIAGARFLEFVAPHLPPGARCLDFGAGDGALVRQLVERGCLAAAYEPSEGRRALIADAALSANERFLGFPGPGEEGSFDVVIAAEVVEHLLDAEVDGVLRAIRRFLRPGGLLIVTTPNDEDLELGACYCPLSDTLFHRWQHVRSFTADSLDQLMSGAGFIRIADHRVDFSSYGDLYEKYLQLAYDARQWRRMGPLYSLLKRFWRRPQDQQLRIGAQTHLIYVGRSG